SRFSNTFLPKSNPKLREVMRSYAKLCELEHLDLARTPCSDENTRSCRCQRDLQKLARLLNDSGCLRMRSTFGSGKAKFRQIAWSGSPVPSASTRNNLSSACDPARCISHGGQNRFPDKTC